MREAMIVLNTMVKDEDVKAHCLASGVLYIKECNNLGLLYNEKVLNTVVLHDIGKSELLDGSSVNEAGYNYLCNSPKVYALAIKNMNTASYLEGCTEVETLVTTIIDYCDVHTNSKGGFCSVDDKLEETLGLYGITSREYRNMLDNINYYYIIDSDIKSTIKRLDELLKDDNM